MSVTITDSARILSATVEFPPPFTGAQRAGTAASRPSYISNNSSVFDTHHPLFVLALLILLQGIGRLFATITAFTLADRPVRCDTEGLSSADRGDHCPVITFVAGESSASSILTVRRVFSPLV